MEAAAGEEGAQAGKAGEEACPMEEAAGEAGPSQAPAAVQNGKLNLQGLHALSVCATSTVFDRSKRRYWADNERAPDPTRRFG